MTRRYAPPRWLAWPCPSCWPSARPRRPAVAARRTRRRLPDARPPVSHARAAAPARCAAARPVIAARFGVAEGPVARPDGGSRRVVLSGVLRRGERGVRGVDQRAPGRCRGAGARPRCRCATARTRRIGSRWNRATTAPLPGSSRARPGTRSVATSPIASSAVRHRRLRSRHRWSLRLPQRHLQMCPRPHPDPRWQRPPRLRIQRPADGQRRRSRWAAALNRQRGAALMIMLLILVLGAAALFARNLAGRPAATARIAGDDRRAGDGQGGPARLRAQLRRHAPGPVRIPALPGHRHRRALTLEGEAHDTVCLLRYQSVMGRLPWKTLGLAPARADTGECLWYAVSGGWKASTHGRRPRCSTRTAAGSSSCVAGDGTTVLAGATAAERAVAVIIAPGQPARRPVAPHAALRRDPVRRQLRRCRLSRHRSRVGHCQCGAGRCARRRRLRSSPAIRAATTSMTRCCSSRAAETRGPPDAPRRPADEAPEPHPGGGEVHRRLRQAQSRRRGRPAPALARAGGSPAVPHRQPCTTTRRSAG